MSGDVERVIGTWEGSFERVAHRETMAPLLQATAYASYGWVEAARRRARPRGEGPGVGRGARAAPLRRDPARRLRGRPRRGPAQGRGARRSCRCPRRAASRGAASPSLRRGLAALARAFAHTSRRGRRVASSPARPPPRRSCTGPCATPRPSSPSTAGAPATSRRCSRGAPAWPAASAFHEYHDELLAVASRASRANAHGRSMKRERCGRAALVICCGVTTRPSVAPAEALAGAPARVSTSTTRTTSARSSRPSSRGTSTCALAANGGDALDAAGARAHRRPGERHAHGPDEGQRAARAGLRPAPRRAAHPAHRLQRPRRPRRRGEPRPRLGLRAEAVGRRAAAADRPARLRGAPPRAREPAPGRRAASRQPQPARRRRGRAAHGRRAQAPGQLAGDGEGPRAGHRRRPAPTPTCCSTARPASARSSSPPPSTSAARASAAASSRRTSPRCRRSS